MNMKEGDVILAPLPQADGAIKNRPTVVLREMLPFKDLLVCGISTQLHQQVKNFDEVIVPSNTDFATSGLLAVSVIRVGFLALVPRKRVIGSIGAISQERHARLLKSLSNYLIVNLAKRKP